MYMFCSYGHIQEKEVGVCIGKSCQNTATQFSDENTSRLKTKQKLNVLDLKYDNCFNTISRTTTDECNANALKLSLPLELYSTRSRSCVTCKSTNQCLPSSSLWTTCGPPKDSVTWMWSGGLLWQLLPDEWRLKTSELWLAGSAKLTQLELSQPAEWERCVNPNAAILQRAAGPVELIVNNVYIWPWF